jgi:hypothetical protein
MDMRDTADSGRTAAGRPDRGAGRYRVAVFLGQDLLAYLVLALGGALVVGNVLALVKPPEQPREGELARAPVARSVTMAIVGAIAAIWAAASLLHG